MSLFAKPPLDKSVQKTMWNYFKEKAYIMLLMFGAFFVGNVMNPFVSAWVKDMYSAYFASTHELQKEIEVEIDQHIADIIFFAKNANRLIVKEDKKACTKIYKKKYIGKPCDNEADSEKIEKLMGNAFLSRKKSYTNSYGEALRKLQNTTLIKASKHFRNIESKRLAFSAWVNKISNNCYFPTDEFSSWGNILKHSIDKRYSFDEKKAKKSIKNAIEVGKSGYPSNCLNYKKGR